MSLGEYIPNTATKLLLHMNGNSNDVSGNGFNGTDTAIAYSQANGKLNSGAGFNGTTSKISMGNVLSFEYNQPFTMSVWCFITTTGQAGIINKSDASDTGYFMYKVANGNIRVLIYKYNCLQFQGDFPTNCMDKPHMLTWCYSGNSDISGFSCYVDGNKITLQSTVNFKPAPSTIITTGLFELGNIRGAGFLGGWIDEVIVENTVWSASKVKKYYTNATKGFF